MATEQSLCEVGGQFEQDCIVDAAARSLAYGGDVDVLATPVIVYWIEAFATQCIRATGDGRYISVGTAVNVRHLAPAPAGSNLHLTLTVQARFEQAVRFAARLVDRATGTIIATGTHDRAITPI